ncbi:MAG: hypothetical protein HUK14_03725 [Muribaculaceae bacterium]|nr:hypothetical protein [Muribaculaceae bacterium]
MNWQLWAALAIVAVAVILALRRLLRRCRRRSPSACANCPLKDNCQSPQR